MVNRPTASMKRLLEKYFNYYCLLFVLVVQAQIKSEHRLYVQLIPEEDQLNVTQEITFLNQADSPIQTLYLNDWANAYSSTETALAKRLVEEFNRSFYLSSKSKRGFTTIHQIHSNDTILTWERPSPHLDRIAIPLPLPLQKNQTKKIVIQYSIKLPDTKFTGYGKSQQKDYFFENFFLTVGWHKDNQWNLISNLDLEDYPNTKADYTIDFELPKKMNVFSNLRLVDVSKNETTSLHHFSGTNVRQLLFHLGENVEYALFGINNANTTIYANFDDEGLNQEKQQQSLQKIFTYVKQKIGRYPHATFLLTAQKYQKRPFYGFTLIPSFLKPYLPEFEFELKALNTFLYHYLSERFSLHPREDFWLLGGLHNYFMMNYVKIHYPNEKLLGLILRQPLTHFFLKKYQFGNMTFDATFLHFHEFMLRRNLQQRVFSNKEDLIRFNEQIGNPSQMGALLNYLYENQQIEMDSLLHKLDQKSINGAALKADFLNHLKTTENTAYVDYFNSRNSLDLYFSELHSSSDQVNFTVNEKNDLKFPFNVGWIRNDTLIRSEKFKASSMGEQIQRRSEKADYLVINPKEKLPEFNPRNNYRKLSRAGKPLRLTFIKDLENPKYKQLFYNPRINFNAYDGLTLGMRLNNLTVQRSPFTFNIEPFYSLKEKNLVGSYAASFALLNENSIYYLKNIGFSGTSYHYDESLRYNLFRASINIYKRDENLRNNRKEALQFFWQYVHREQNSSTDINPNYNLGGMRYVISNKGALNYFTLVNQVEISHEFGKLNVTANYRHLFPSGRQFSMRMFAGKFLYRDSATSNYFDYALDRPTDYLFRYNYLGRSETTGFYSQQYIAAEGGFKSKFENPLINDYIVSINSSMGLWKWFEIYGDLGWMKSQDASSRTLYDLGLRFNLLPDFLELYFPCYNSKGFQLDKPSYNQQIRFVLTLDPKTLNQLFTRKWF